MTDKAKKKIIRKQSGDVICPGCGEVISEEEDLSEIEYVRTKRRTDIFFHRHCFGKIWE